MRLMNSLSTNILSCMKQPERNCLMLTSSISKIWEKVKSDIKKLSFVSIDVFVNCVYTKDHFSNFVFLSTPFFLNHVKFLFAAHLIETKN